MQKRRAVIELFLASALGLFVELVFIRWIASELRIFSFYKNFALIAAYLGLGLGFVVYRPDRVTRLLVRVYLPLIALIVLVVLGTGRTMLSDVLLSNPTNAQEYIWAGHIGDLGGWLLALRQAGFYAVLLGMFLALTIMFVPLGQLTADKFAAFRPLPGYTINVLGSLAGVATYTAISFLGWPPAVWFLIAGAGVLYFIPKRPPRAGWACAVLAAVPVLLTLLWPTRAQRTLWSPYYRIDITESRAEGKPDLLLGYDLAVNLAWHQRLVNLSPGFVSQNYSAAPAHFDAMQAEYDAPYRAAAALGRVLVVGAGTGNDVAAALRAGARAVTAVEIDPVILRIGKELHPEHPYDSPAVQLVNEDARSFFTRDRGSYDLIVFGLLDSHTLFSTASSVRLDNFVYTRESLARVRDLLAPGGVLALSFGVPVENEWVGLRMFRTLVDVYGHSPQVFEFPNHDILFLIGRAPGSTYSVRDPRVSARPDYSYHPELAPVTDDWPYLYLRERTVPSTYLIALAGVALITVLLLRRSLPRFTALQPSFFFLGAAFFLMETKSVTEMALLFGSTWVVNAAVISAILVMIVLANLVVEKFDLRTPTVYYLLLAVALVIGYAVPVRSFLGLAPAVRTLLAGLEQALPLFFAAFVFAIQFRRTASIPVALGSNLLGGVLGGAMEYASLALGIRSLYLLGLALYALSALPLMAAARRQRRLF